MDSFLRADDGRSEPSIRIGADDWNGLVETQGEGIGDNEKPSAAPTSAAAPLRGS